MSHTAYSQHFGQELDFKQLLTVRGVTASLEQVDYGLSQVERDWMRSDLLCPSCRCGGASLVRSDVAKGRGRNTRQAHFRFIDASGHTAHKLGCDFYAMDDVPGLQNGVDVQFSVNDKDTKVIRSLVCKAIAIGELSKTAIFEMRSWFLGQRDTNTFKVQGTPAMVDWLWAVRRLPFYEAIRFEPFHRALPGFYAKHAALRDLAFQYRDLMEKFPSRLPFDAETRDRAKRIVSAKQGQMLICMEPLRPQFEATSLTAQLMAEYGDLPLTKRKTLKGTWGDTPEALLAFSATLLFVSHWDVNVALSRFTKIIAAPVSEDQTLGNVMGLNPFHDFAAIEVIRFISRLPQETERPYNLQEELAAVHTKIENSSS